MSKTDPKIVAVATAGEFIQFDPTALEVVEFAPLATSLKELQIKCLNTVYDTEDEAQFKQLVTDHKHIRDCRIEVEETHKRLKAPVLVFGKLLDSRKNELVAEYKALEAPLLAQIDAQKNKQKRLEEEAAKAIADRLASFDAKINAITALPMQCVGKTAAELLAIIEPMRNKLPDIGEFYERTDMAVSAHLGTLQQLELLLVTKTQQEADQAELAELRAFRAAKEATEQVVAAATPAPVQDADADIPTLTDEVEMGGVAVATEAVTTTDTVAQLTYKLNIAKGALEEVLKEAPNLCCIMDVEDALYLINKK